MSIRRYRFYVQPVGPQKDATNEALADLLNSEGHSAVDCEHQVIQTAVGEIEGVYEVPTHSIITMISNSYFHRNNIHVFVQEGEGQIRVYNLFPRGGRLSRTKAVREAREKLEELLVS